MTKDEVTEQILSVLKDSSGMVNPSVITQKLRWNKDIIAEICELFGVQKFTEVLAKIPGIKMSKNESGTAYVQFVQDAEPITQQNATQEENNMAENNTKTEKLHDRIEKLRDALSSGLYEKDEAVRLALLTAVAGESIFFLGAPGCAKSMIARRVVQAFKADGDGSVKYFETVLNQFSTPEEVAGNVSIKSLTGEGESGEEEYCRLLTDMLPDADIAFLDEIWKASPAILNTLLPILNERQLRNGRKMVHVPLKALFAASNELPAKDRGLEALYDRLIFRLPIHFIQNEENFFDMLEDSSSSDFELPNGLEQITKDELKKWCGYYDVNKKMYIAGEIDTSVMLSEEAKSVISAIRKELTARNEAMSDEGKKNGELWEVGDRRWKKIAHILKASAFLNDRAAVDLMDCQLIEYCIWATSKQQTQARDIVEKCIKQNGLDCDSAIDDINEQIEEFAAAVDGQWFEGNAGKLYEMSDGIMAYKIQNPSEVYFADHRVTPYYICKDSYWSNHRDRFGMLFDSNRNKLGVNYNYSFSNFDISNGEVSWTDWWRNYHGYSDREYTMQIETEPKPKKFSDIAHETLQKNFDKEHYAPIVDKINAEIATLKAKKDADAVPFKANLFANQEYNTSITAKVDDAIHQLEDAKVSLDKQRNRYFKSELVAELSVGDVILKNGIVYTADEIENLTNEQKEDVIAVVCVAGEKTYAIGIEQYSDAWDKIAKIASDYGTDNNLPTAYASNWAVPDKDLLAKIWENRETVNISLKVVGENACTLNGEEYWSSTENGSSAAFYQLFDDEGKKDDTTKSHEYSICLVREWKKE